MTSKTNTSSVLAPRALLVLPTPHNAHCYPTERNAFTISGMTNAAD